MAREHKATGGYSTSVICKVFMVSRGSLYTKPKGAKDETKLEKLIKDIFEENWSCYGKRRIRLALI